MTVLQRLFPGMSHVRFRGPDRDRETDVARMDAVGSSIGAALASVDAEIAGLTRRRDEALQRANCLVGTADACEYGRDEDEERGLVAAEVEIRNANLRLTSLNAQRRMLADLEFSFRTASASLPGAHA